MIDWQFEEICSKYGEMLNQCNLPLTLESVRALGAVVTNAMLKHGHFTVEDIRAALASGIDFGAQRRRECEQPYFLKENN